MQYRHLLDNSILIFEILVLSKVRLNEAASEACSIERVGRETYVGYFEKVQPNGAFYSNCLALQILNVPTSFIKKNYSDILLSSRSANTDEM